MVKNTMELIKTAEMHIDDKYDIGLEIVQDIRLASRESYDLIYYGFLFGYMQGMKAERDMGGQ